MLFLLFQLGAGRYALEASRVVEVLPLVALTPLPQSPCGVAGIFNYRGQPVPAIDLCELTLGQPAAERLSTRIIVIDYHAGDGTVHRLGLIAEQATQMLRRELKDFVEPSLKLRAAPKLGPVLLDGQGPIQWVTERGLIPEVMRELLFADAGTVNRPQISSPSLP